MKRKKGRQRIRPSWGMLAACALLHLCGCSQAPQVEITTPEEGQVLTSSPVTVSGTATDDKGVASAELTVGGDTYPLSLGPDGSFSQEVPLQEGENRIEVTALDTEGLTGADAVNVNFASPVAIEITSPGDGAIVNSDRVAVKGTVGGSNPQVLVNGVVAQVEAGEFLARDCPLVEGQTQLTALALHRAYDVVLGSDAVTVTTTESKVPVKMIPSATHGVPPVGVDFTLALDTDNPIVNYKWDLDSDGAWEIDSPDQTAASASYGQARPYRPAVMVTDSQGVSFCDRVSINVHGEAVPLGTLAGGSPSDIVRKQDGKFLVLDSAACTVTEYDAEGVPTGFAFGSCGTGDGEFQSPMGLALGPYGHIYVADTGNNRVQKFDSQGGFRLAFSNWTCGTSTGPFDQPYGIAVDSSSRAYVVDRGNGRLMTFDNDFCDCALGYPSGMLDDPRRVQVDGRGYIYIVGNGFYNQNKGSVNILTTSGQYVTTLNADTGLSLAAPYDLEVEDGRIYIADAGAGKVWVLDDDFENLRVENEVTGVATSPLALAVGTRAAQDTVLAVDDAASAVAEAQMPVDSPVAVWEALKAALAAGDFPGALAYISEDSRARYEEAFSVLGDRLPPAAATWGSLTPVSFYGDMASYTFQQEEPAEGGGTHLVTHSAMFARDKNGQWKIEGF